MNNFEDDLELQMCGGCGRRFERRAALNSHSQICQKRIAVQNNIKARRRSPFTSATTTSNRITSTKTFPTSADRHTENNRNDIACVESNTSRLTPLSVHSESMHSTSSGMKNIINPSPSPVPLDISNQLLASSPSASYHRTRHCSGSWSDSVKKDIPEKRIEIQIRRDYCKTGTGAGTVSSVLEVGVASSQQQDCNSETNETPLSCDDTGEGNNHDEISDIFNDNIEGHSMLHQSTEPDMCFSKKDPLISPGKLDDNIGINVCSFTETIEKEAIMRDEESTDGLHIHLPAVRNVNGDGSSVPSVQDIGLISNDNLSEESLNITEKEKTDTCTSNFMRFIENQSDPSDRRTRWDSASSPTLSESLEAQDEVKKAVDEQGNEFLSSPNIRKEEQFSPVMENRMQSMINIRRLQCLPCQKKFNKLTNLRRHVAVHIGWNRYRCIKCTFKCFSKYDCVAHVNKVHLGKGEHDKAHSMVEYIETQISDIDNDSIKYEPTEETYRSQTDENGCNRYEGVSEDMEITVNDASCNNVTDWPLEKCDENKAIITSDYDISIEAVPNDIQNSMMRVGSPEENDLYAACTVEDRRVATVDVPLKPDPVITSGGMSNIATTTKLESENVNETVVRDAATILQTEEASKRTISTSPLRLQPKRQYMSTKGLGHEKPEDIPSKKLLTTAEYQQNIRNVAVLGKRL